MARLTPAAPSARDNYSVCVCVCVCVCFVPSIDGGSPSVQDATCSTLCSVSKGLLHLFSVIFCPTRANRGHTGGGKHCGVKIVHTQSSFRIVARSRHNREDCDVLRDSLRTSCHCVAWVGDVSHAKTEKKSTLVVFIFKICSVCDVEQLLEN